MPMTGMALGALIKTKIIAKKGAPASDQDLKDFCDAVGEAVVEYIQSDAKVTIDNATVISGAGAGGQVTGTGVVG